MSSTKKTLPEKQKIFLAHFGVSELPRPTYEKKNREINV